MKTSKRSTRPLLGLGMLCAPLLMLAACSGGDFSSSEDAGLGTATTATSASGGDAAEGGGGEGLGVGQGGSQDFGQFKEILDRGEIPGPNTIDDVGFFNEHKLTLPTPACPNDVCVHGLFGQMGNMITGSDCITVLVGLNTAIDI